MTFQTKLGQLIPSSVADNKFVVVEALANLLKAKMPLPVKFMLSEILDEVDAKTKKFREQQIALLKEHGEEIKDEQGNVIKLQAHPEKMSFINEELQKLADLDIELPGKKFNLDDFKHVDSEDDSIHWVKWLFEKPVDEVPGEVV